MPKVEFMEQDELNILIGQAESGNEQALAQLFEKYRHRLRRMVELRMNAQVRSRLDASDVVQEAFVEIARRIRTRHEEINIPIFLWMRLVTGDRLAQLHRTHLRTGKRNAFRDVSLNRSVPGASHVYLASQLAGQFTSVDRGLIREEVSERLEAALNSLDEGDREVIAMRHFEELSTDEIAIVLGISVSGVLKRYARAIRRLTRTIDTNSDISKA